MNKDNAWRVLIVSSVAFSMFWGVFYLWVTFAKVIVDVDDGSRLSSALQASGSFFASFAVVVSIVSLYFQRSFFKAQEDRQKRETIDRQFWDGVSRLDSVCSGLKYYSFGTDGKKEYNGLEVMRLAVDEITAVYKGDRHYVDGSFELMLGHYDFSRYMSIFGFVVSLTIDNEATIGEMSDEYNKMIASMLSEIELLYIALICAACEHYSEIKVNVEKAALLRNVDIKHLPGAVLDKYNGSAFGRAFDYSQTTTPPP